ETNFVFFFYSDTSYALVRYYIDTKVFDKNNSKASLSQIEKYISRFDNNCHI
ncbi:MAG: hypothetical protein ACI8RD_012801, partial [Bacillariaceae sp.]